MEGMSAPKPYEDNFMHVPQVSNKVDIGTIAAGAVVIAMNLLGAGVLWGSITNQITTNQQANVVWQTNSDKAYAEIRSNTDARFSALETKIQPVDGIVYRLTKAETDIINNNVTISARVDRISDSFGDRLEALRKDVNLLGTKVEVLTATIIDQNRRQSLQGKKPGD